MPRYYFQIGYGRYQGVSTDHFSVANPNAAWQEMTLVCSDLVRSVTRDLKPNTDWQIVLLNEAKKPLFRIRITAEAPDNATEESKVCEPSDP
jgi:hypothetical protein